MRWFQLSRTHNAGVLGTATPGVLRAFPHLSSPEVPSLRRRYPASPVVRTSPPPGPACPLRGSGWCLHTTARASRVATSSLSHTCRHHYPGGSSSVPLSLFFPTCRRPSPNLRRVGSRIALFEACTVFTNVPACMVAELLIAAL